MISLQDVSKSFGSQQVLKNLSLQIDEGSTQVLLGLSGSGKTTTLKLMNGLLKADEGHITLFGKPIDEHNLQRLRRKMGYVIQQAGLFPHYTVARNVAVVPELLKWPDSKINKRSAEILEKLHLDPAIYLEKYPAQLSGGEKQRVGLARAMAASPPVLLMDEPFGALDPITRHRIKQEFLQLDELKDKTVVMVTHDVKVAFELGDKVALMHEGKILQNDKPKAILENPKNERIIEFLENDWLTLKLITENRLQGANERLMQHSSDDWNKIIGL